MFFHDQGISQRDHEQHAQETAAHRDDGNADKIRRIHKAFGRPQEQDRHGKDNARGQRLAGRSDRLDHVALKHGIPFQDHAHHRHGNDRSRYGCGYCHTDAETQVGISRTEDHRQKNTDHYGGCCQLLGIFFV